MDRFYRGSRKVLSRWLLYFRSLGKWLTLAGITGVLCGLVGSAFHLGVQWATQLRLGHPWLLYTLPLLGLGIVGIYKLFGTEGQSTDSIIEEVQSGHGLSLALLPSIFLSTLLTHLGGGSVGREGAALQMGGTIGYHIGTVLLMDDKDLRTATMTGMAAFFSALFGTPLAATVFAMAVISVGLLYHAALIPCLIASLVAYWISLLVGVEPTRFLVAAPAPDFLMFFRVAALAFLCAIVTILFCRTIHGMEHLFRRKLKSPWLRIVLGGALVVGLSLLVGSGDYNGAGMDIITAAVEEGRARPEAFALKILFTAVSLAAGFKGGEVVPSFFVGATFGCVVGPLLGIPAGFAAALSLVAVFCSAVNCPLASIFLSVELFGADGILYFALACGLSFVLSGYNGLYSSQRILYDKLKAQYINVHANAHHEGEITETEKLYR